MCRMFGFVAAAPVVPRALLRGAPRSLETLSHEHPDGWGVALHADDDWTVHRGTACAAKCARYAEVVDRAETAVLVAHVRQKTVGETSLRNTHPFRRGPFVFAHNGTVRALAALDAQTSATRRAEVEGDTDSERLFAFVLTHVDAHGDVAIGITAAVDELHALGDLGSASFLFSCGARIYAHRLGRELHTLVRQGEHERRRTAAIVVASERLTDEAWTEVPERSLLVIDTTGITRLPTQQSRSPA